MIISPNFPNLNADNQKVTSPKTRAYNCMAWAAGIDSQYWDPRPDYYWPTGAARRNTLDSYTAAYGAFGYEPCDDSKYEAGFEKIAVYTLDGEPTHAARQLPSGAWTSKLGPSHDIEHTTLEALNGPLYGEPNLYLKRKAKAA